MLKDRKRKKLYAPGRSISKKKVGVDQADWAREYRGREGKWISMCGVTKGEKMTEWHSW